MRQFVFGILIAAFLYWGYDQTFGEPAAASPRPPESAAAPSADPAAAVGNGTSLDVLGVAKQPALVIGAVEASVVVTDLVESVGKREVAAFDQAWSALGARSTQLATSDRRRLAEALAGPGSDFAALLGQLGSGNAFLHSVEGRAQAGKALAAAMALADADAVAAGSQLITLCLRGSIEKGDTEARGFVDEAYKQHRVRVDRWLCDPSNVAGARSYTVAGGDSLSRIATRFQRDKILVDEGTIAVLNRIHNPNAIQLGQKIKVPVEPVFAVVEKRSFSLAVQVGAHLLRLYWIGHGKDDRTPVTEFTVAEKQPKPEWTAPDGNVYAYGRPENILGEYLIKFRHESYTGFGAHGTPMPDTIGTMSSAGCIRMLAPDIAELFKILPRGAKVVIKASPAVR